MLARRAASEVTVHHQNGGSGESGIVERMYAGARCATAGALVLEYVAFEPLERNRAQEPRRHDAVGVDVIATHGQRTPFHDRNASCVHHTSSRTSVTSPVTAAAATMAGLMSSVLPVGLPCRPLKLRFDDDAQT